MRRACDCLAVEDRLGRGSRERHGELLPGEVMSCVYGLFDLLLARLVTPLAVGLGTSVFGWDLVTPMRDVGLEWRRLDHGTMPCPLIPESFPHSGPGGSTRRQRDRASLVMSGWRGWSVRPSQCSPYSSKVTQPGHLGAGPCLYKGSGSTSAGRGSQGRTGVSSSRQHCEHLDPVPLLGPDCSLYLGTVSARMDQSKWGFGNQAEV